MNASSERPALRTPSLNLPTYWLSLHSAAKRMPELAGKPEQERELLQQNFRKLLEELTDYPVEKWIHFCELSGPTIEGLVAASWCQGASFSHLLDFWSALSLETLNLETNDRQLLREARQNILPGENLSDLIDLGKDVEGVLLLILIVDGSFRQDLPKEKFAVLNKGVCEALEGRLIFT